ncbi:MAG: aspartate kinase [Saprospiraceae bacterium]|nr:aspartate kinase [Saprospiraceae bacterium]
MVVFKFGGTSLGSPDRMKQVAAIVMAEPGPKCVVLSAVSGTTNKLVALNQAHANGEGALAEQQIEEFASEYLQYTKNLLVQDDLVETAMKIVSNHLHRLREVIDLPPSPESERVILAQGELISTNLFVHYLESQSIQAKLLPALEFMRIDKTGDPDAYFISSMLGKEMQLHPDHQFFVTQGFICRNAFGEVDNLKRGGSDFTATLIGEALHAREVQIWTDIDGLHNNDPRVVDKTFPISRLSYREAAELAYFGAKILHPTCVLPAERAGIPIYLKNTMDPKAEGTKISTESAERSFTALAAKDNITAVKITSGRMLNAYGFLRRVFEIFERYETSIDMITTSEVAVSLTIDDDRNLPRILQELKPLGRVEVDTSQASICVVGNFALDQKGYASQIFDALHDISIRMISYGGSKYNVSILVKGEDKEKALIALNQGLFGLT